MNRSAAALSADSFSPCKESCLMEWRWQKRQSQPDEALNSCMGLLSPRASFNRWCNSRAFACTIGPLIGIPSSRFCLNHKKMAASNSSSLPSFIIFVDRPTPISVIFRLYARSAGSHFLMSLIVDLPIPYSLQSTVYDLVEI